MNIPTLGKLPNPRTKHSSVLYDSYMIIFGGLFIIDLDNKILIQNENENENKIEQLHPLTWYNVKIDNLYERIWHSSHIISSKKYVSNVYILFYFKIPFY